MFKVTRFHAVANRAQHQQQQWIECNRSKCFLCFVVFFFVFVSFLYFELNWSKWRKRRNNAFAKEENARSFIDYHPLSSGFGFYLCVARRQRKFEKFWFYKRIELIWKLNECFFYIACIGWGISVYFFFFCVSHLFNCFIWWVPDVMRRILADVLYYNALTAPEPLTTEKCRETRSLLLPAFNISVIEPVKKLNTDVMWRGWEHKIDDEATAKTVHNGLVCRSVNQHNKH